MPVAEPYLESGHDCKKKQKFYLRTTVPTRVVQVNLQLCGRHAQRVVGTPEGCIRQPTRKVEGARATVNDELAERRQHVHGVWNQERPIQFLLGPVDPVGRVWEIRGAAPCPGRGAKPRPDGLRIEVCSRGKLQVEDEQPTQGRVCDLAPRSVGRQVLLFVEYERAHAGLARIRAHQATLQHQHRANAQQHLAKQHSRNRTQQPSWRTHDFCDRDVKILGKQIPSLVVDPIEQPQTSCVCVWKRNYRRGRRPTTEGLDVVGLYKD